MTRAVQLRRAKMQTLPLSRFAGQGLRPSVPACRVRACPSLAHSYGWGAGSAEHHRSSTYACAEVDCGLCRASVTPGYMQRLATGHQAQTRPSTWKIFQGMNFCLGWGDQSV